MKKWIEMRLPTEWEHVGRHYAKDEDKIYIIGWKTDHENETGEIIATIKVATRELQYFDPDALLDGYAHSVVILAFNDIENGEYNHVDDINTSKSSYCNDDDDDVYSLGI